MAEKKKKKRKTKKKESLLSRLKKLTKARSKLKTSLSLTTKNHPLNTSHYLLK